ncbi:hypothetical protein MBT84_43175 [Streptomyces sp. MBT84]|uniref:hypothetical protein n=1 Tax=Streptomyces sp. MBT84 TaxID=1488414 RepID=UPI001D654430|nr:hypothetical protein [Streptomyces sp. MBT84]MBW8706445.1 hypothetical protein [Streptomyces sp. MBT84]
MVGTTTHPATLALARSVARLEIAVEEDYEQFRARYEQAVPPLDYRRTFDLVTVQAPWSAVQDLADENAPLGFMIFWKFDAQPLFGVAGDHARCTEYLMGNHVIAERMYRHDAGALLYVPLRTTIHESPSGRRCSRSIAPVTRSRYSVDPRSPKWGGSWTARSGLSCVISAHRCRMN